MEYNRVIALLGVFQKEIIYGEAYDVSDLENDRRSVSRKMAVALGEVFECDPALFFDFGS